MDFWLEFCQGEVSYKYLLEVFLAEYFLSKEYKLFLFLPADISGWLWKVSLLILVQQPLYSNATTATDSCYPTSLALHGKIKTGGVKTLLIVWWSFHVSGGWRSLKGQLWKTTAVWNIFLNFNHLEVRDLLKSSYSSCLYAHRRQTRTLRTIFPDLRHLF